LTPGPVVRARELYGATLLEEGMAMEALAAFEGTLKKVPNRLGATIGAAKAAEKAGDAVRARQHYAAVVALTGNADPVRPELAHARAFMARAQKRAGWPAVAGLRTWLSMRGELDLWLLT
jgi:hypothetical protein